jgi:hypothetical protein
MILSAITHDNLQFWLLDTIAGALVLVIGFIGNEFAKQIKGLRTDFQSSQILNAKTVSDVNNLVTSDRDVWEEIRIIRAEIVNLKEGAVKRETLISEFEKNIHEIRNDLKEVTQVQNRYISCNDNKK